MQKAALLGLLLFTTVLTRGQELVWVEAEHFKDAGGWTNDWQFFDQMGSPYLMAVGYGAPVQDAKTSLTIKKPGKYRLWVRTIDWLPENHPGTFEVSVNGKKAKKSFGASGVKEWRWEDGGIFDLKSQADVSLKDLTGYYGRCDALVFSADTTWTPPAEKAELLALREKQGAISQQVKEMGDYDVVVIGGGIAGCMAAVSAARQGARTVLIQNRDQLGGNASLENLVPPVGSVKTKLSEEEKKYDPRETGLIEEVATYGDQKYFTAGKYWPSRLLNLVKSEPNLDLFLNTHATGVQMQGENQIAGVECIVLPEGQRVRFKGKLFIDCTGNGIVGVKAGAEYLYGRESKAMYDETKAPDTADETTLPSSLKYWYLSHDQPQSFESPSWIYSFPQCSDFGEGRHPKVGPIDNQWVIELGGTNRTYSNAEEVRDDLFRLIYGIWDHLKNNCPEARESAKNLKLVWVGHVVGLRESYRLLGDYVMSERDVTEQRLLPDRVAYGGWGLDDHPSEGFFDKVRLNNHTHKGVFHSIPYRSLYSKNIDNLMMAGRDISVTHVALTATRVMYTTGIIGHAAGTAAGLCIAKNTTPKGLYQNNLADLQQQLMKEGAYLIELPNQDPNDLALRASVKASTELTPATEAINGYSRARLPVTLPYAETRLNAWIPDTLSGKPEWLEVSWPTPQTFNVVHVSFQNRELAPRNFRIEQLKGGKWVALKTVDNLNQARRFVLPVGDVTSKAVRIVLPDKDKSGGICEVRVYRENERMVEIAQRANLRMSQPDEEVDLPWEGTGQAAEKGGSR